MTVDSAYQHVTKFRPITVTRRRQTCLSIETVEECHVTSWLARTLHALPPLRLCPSNSNHNDDNVDDNDDDKYLGLQRPIAIKLSRGRSVGLSVRLSVRRSVQCIVEKRRIGSRCRLAS